MAHPFAVPRIDGSGPIRNERGCMFGSTRLMAPEEFELGALLDERTTVFTLGRAVLVLLGGDSRDGRPFFAGTPEQLRVARAATEPDPADRLPSIAAFARAWRDTGR
jgi:serine/threonine protein kinase, bacterial